MGTITLNSKGSRNRVRNRDQYRKNFDDIDWKTKAPVSGNDLTSEAEQRNMKRKTK
jgi:hypothetical protein